MEFRAGKFAPRFSAKLHLNKLMMPLSLLNAGRARSGGQCVAAPEADYLLDQG